MTTTIKTHFLAFAAILAVGGGLHAAPASEAPITELKELRPEDSVFAADAKKKPIVLKSTKDGEKYFGKEALAKLSKTVDFKKQIVLVFAWKGSGQDRLAHSATESRPAKVTFSHRPGRTRDLRPHVKVYVLDSDTTWTVK